MRYSPTTFAPSAINSLILNRLFHPRLRNIQFNFIFFLFISKLVVYCNISTKVANNFVFCFILQNTTKIFQYDYDKEMSLLASKTKLINLWDLDVCYQ